MSIFQKFRHRNTAKLILEVAAEFGHVYRRDLTNRWDEEIQDRATARKHTNDSLRMLKRIGVIHMKDNMVFVDDESTLRTIARGEFTSGDAE